MQRNQAESVFGIKGLAGYKMNSRETFFKYLEWSILMHFNMYIYVPQTKFGRPIVFAPFLIIIIIILLLLSFFRQKFVQHISRSF
jgi:hypothetical protein